MKIKKISSTRFLNRFFFILTFAIRAWTDAMYVSKGKTSSLISMKYITLFLGLSFCFAQMLRWKPECGHLFSKELKKVLIVVVSFLILTLIISFVNRTTGNEMTSELFKMLLPAVTAYFVLNTFDLDDLYVCMSWILFISLICYIMEVGLDTFTISNIMKISFSTSYSPFESHFASGTAVSICAFFMYYRKNSIMTLLSLVFVLLTFKRLSVLFGLLLFFLPLFVDINKEIRKHTKNIMKFVFFFLTLGYYELLRAVDSNFFEIVFNTDATAFTMMRNVFLDRLLKNGFVSAGLGSTTVFMDNSLEMDLIKILLELTVVGLGIFVWCYWDCAGTKVYSFVYMTYKFITMLVSHSLDNPFNWILSFVTLGCIIYGNGQSSWHYQFKKKHPRTLLQLIKHRRFNI